MRCRDQVVAVVTGRTVVMIVVVVVAVVVPRRQRWRFVVPGSISTSFADPKDGMKLVFQERRIKGRVEGFFVIVMAMVVDIVLGRFGRCKLVSFHTTGTRSSAAAIIETAGAPNKGLVAVRGDR